MTRVYTDQSRFVEGEYSEESMVVVVEDAVAGVDSQVQRTQGFECAMI